MDELEKRKTDVSIETGDAGTRLEENVESTTQIETDGDKTSSEIHQQESKITEKQHQKQEKNKHEDASEETITQQPDSKKPKGKKIAIVAAIAALTIALIATIVSNSGLKHQIAAADAANAGIQKELDEANETIKDLKKQVKTLEEQVDDLENGAAAQLVEIKNAFDASNWEKVVKKAAELHKAYNGSAEDVEAQQLSAQAQEKIDAENAAKAAEEAKGYETGITYDQLARTPDDYKGSKVKFSGKVVQVIEGDDTVQLRLAVNNSYDNILFLEYESSLVKSRVLEDDHITIYGISAGTITYESTMGGKITIPAVLVEKIDQ